MRILYLSSSYIPSRRASSVHVMRMCQALAKQGNQVTLVSKKCAKRQELNVQDDYNFYGVASVFKILKLTHPAWRGGGYLYAFNLLNLLRKKRQEADLVYSRDLPGAWLATLLNHPVIFEVHGMPQGFLSRLIFRKLLRSRYLRRLVVISESLRTDLSHQNLLPMRVQTVVAHDGADLVQSIQNHITLAGRFHSDKPNLGYIGHLYTGKGAEVVIALAKRLGDCNFHIVGGTEKDLARMRHLNPPENVIFHGFVNPRELQYYYREFDILLLPPQLQVYAATGDLDISRWMSPMKMFEYMATGKPIISSDLPVLREVLEDGHNALLVPPDDVNAWVIAIQRLLADPALGRRLGKNARDDLANHYTWDARAKKVLDDI